MDSYTQLVPIQQLPGPKSEDEEKKKKSNIFSLILGGNYGRE